MGTSLDAAILDNDDQRRGCALDFLADDIVVPVCSSGCAQEHGLREEKDLDRCILIHLFGGRPWLRAFSYRSPKLENCVEANKNERKPRGYTKPGGQSAASKT